MKKTTKNLCLLLALVSMSILFFSCSSSDKTQAPQASASRPLLTAMNDEIQITNLGKGINSPQRDFSFRQAHNGENAFFTSSRPFNRKDSFEDDIYTVPRKNNTWGRHRSAGDILNVEDAYEPEGDGTCAISFDGRTLYFVSGRSDKTYNADIFYATLIDGEWEDVKTLGPPINTQYFESHPSISPDNKTLFFCSNRPGGYGGQDIWYSERDEDGRWGEPINMGPEINTAKRESAPFIAADNATLYFTSDGLGGYGGQDIFVSYKQPNGQWGKPQNIGAPVNSSYDDRFPYVPTSGKMLYFSSNRPGGIGDFDVYTAVPNPMPPKGVPTISGIVTSAVENLPLQVNIKVLEIASNQSINFESEKLTGKYFSVIPSGKKYEVSVFEEGYIPYSQTIEVPGTDEEIVLNITLNRVGSNLNINVSHILPLSEIIETDPMLVGFKGLLHGEVNVNELVPILHYVFFDKESSKIPTRYQLFESPNETHDFSETSLFGEKLIQYYHVLNIVGSRLRARPDITITLVGCNDNNGREYNNTGVSRARAETVQNYLTSIWGIDKNRIKITVRNLPIIPSSQGTSAGQAENRRVEIIGEPEGSLFEPVYIERTEMMAAPDKVVFNVSTVSEESLKGWNLTVTQSGKLLTQFSGNTQDSSVTWNWLDASETLPQDDKPIVYWGTVYNIYGDTAVSSMSQIPVNKVVLTSADEKMVGRVFEKMTLFLYDFGQSTLSPQHMEIIRSMLPKINPYTKVSILGHTDNIGTDEVNINLSRNRAREVYNTLQNSKRARTYTYEGLGKANPLYNNVLPEGRFYNRTVEVIIESDIRQ